MMPNCYLTLHRDRELNSNLGTLPLVQGNMATKTVAAKTTEMVTITFPKSYKAPPSVVVTIRATAYPELFNVTVASATTTQANIYLINKHTVADPMKFNWIAVGEPA